MGENWSCCRSEEFESLNYRQELDMSLNKITYTKQEAGVDIQGNSNEIIQVTFNGKINLKQDETVLQSAARGYMARKEIEKKREAIKGSKKLIVTVNEPMYEAPFKVAEKSENLNSDSPKATSFPTPEELYEELSSAITKHQANTVSALENALGEFDISEPLNDGVPVKAKPALLLKDGTIYQGEWNSNSQKHGRGIEISQDGSKFIGYFVNGQKEGKGRIIHINSDVYQGDFKKDKANGFGIYIHEDGSKYEGEFKNDEQHGHGREEYSDGSVYEGDYRKGMKEGKGVFKWADGSYFEGDFKANNREGIGTYVWADKKAYTGEWKNGKMNGKGVFKWADGREYSGEYVNDLKEGHGKFVWPDGRIYDGEWKEGKQHGIGTYSFYTKHVKHHKVKQGEWHEGYRVRWLYDESEVGDSIVNISKA
ncbi:unnamed protein product [Blepharisma stoltei]|uniref:MORN repeat protein n=1 Tax=Blepharisma stoltei TaxID=1481888 RepID=A0AAU9JHZ8_9CILI|nr:unnamed protein product [Blepharisma stoltei]